jgi:hypothetical protein
MSHSSTIRITRRGTSWRGALAVLGVAAFGLLGVPRLLSRAPSREEAERLVRLLQAREVSAPFLARLDDTPADSLATLQVEMARAVGEVERTSFDDVRVRRSLVGPPFTRRFAYAVETRESGSSTPGYYRISRGIASESSRLYWLVPIF